MRTRHLVACIVAATLAAPAHGQWSTETLPQARGEIAATSVQRLSLFAGGNTGSGPVDRVDLYNHARRAWLTPAALSAARNVITATSAGGRAFFAGGLDPVTGFGVDVVDVYDPVAGWSVEHLSQARFFIGAASHRGKVYFAGGVGLAGGGTSDVVDVYDTATDTWSVLHLSVPRGVVAVEPAGDLVLFAGGRDFNFAWHDVVEVYDTVTGTWLPPMRLSAPRGFFPGYDSASAGDLAIFTGGYGPAGYTDVVDIYDAATDTWSTTTLSAARGGIGACVVGNRLVFAGGTDGTQDLAVVDVYDSGTGLWSTASLSQPRSLPAATAVGGRALFAGGYPGSGYSDVVDVFEPLGVNYCTAEPNSTGAPAVMVAGGSVSLANDELTLTAAPVPDQPFLFFHGPSAAEQPFGDGHLCVGGSITRIPSPGVASGNVAQRVVDPAAAGIVSPGTLHFQCWYRDPAAGGAGFNTSDAIEVVFVP